jgi:ribosome-associated translation inhibitor RaiA
MGGFDWRATEVGQKGKRKQAPVNGSVPVEIPDAEHETVIERAAAIRNHIAHLTAMGFHVTLQPAA